METRYDYVVVGGGLAGMSAIEGIRQQDDAGSILLLAREPELPYHRPPLTKQLWFGKKTVQDIYPHDRQWYAGTRVDLLLGRSGVKLDAAAKVVVDDHGDRHAYGKLLIATGGTPRRMNLPGGALTRISYFRTVEDYRGLRTQAKKGASAVVIGGGFIGSEIAAALARAEVSVTMVFPGPYLGHHLFPRALGSFLQRQYVARGIRVLHEDRPTAIVDEGGRLVTVTRSGARLQSDMVVVGAGIEPTMDLARDAGLSLEDGILVTDRLHTSDRDVYAAGDAALFPYAALGRRQRVEHWDNAIAQGKQAGRNMAGADEPYLHMPFFFSDLFEFGYEAVGDIDARLDTFADWQEENKVGIVYYLSDDRVRGVMMCNVWDKVDAARRLIQTGASRSGLRGAIR